MITYICRNKNKETGEALPCTNNICETSTCPVCGGRADASSQIYWCEDCKTPLYEEHCGICGKKAKKLCKYRTFFLYYHVIEQKDNYLKEGISMNKPVLVIMAAGMGSRY